MATVLACDLGTGGCKSSLYGEDGVCLREFFHEYPTRHPRPEWHEQRPDDWVDAVVGSARALLDGQPPVFRDGVAAIALSGQSLAMIPLDASGETLLDWVPIWSDGRVGPEDMRELFSRVSECEWYMTTGNGFPARLYTVFKVYWLRKNHPGIFARTKRIVGSKDYVNYRLTGRLATDPSYASGSGLFGLSDWDYSRRLLAESGLDPELFPDLVPSVDLLGTLTRKAAERLGLGRKVKVVAGGVDNSCMALGAMCFRDGRIYNSLGSSSWFSLSSAAPVLDPDKRPYVFAHVCPRQYVSSTSIFSAGSSYKWFRNTLAGSADYGVLDAEAASAPVGCAGLMFNPTLAGGSSLDASPLARGGFAGLALGHSRAHLARAVMEGVAMGLRLALDELRRRVEVSDEMLLVGGGGNSPLWRQILADALRLRIVQTNVGQQAATLGAAALALVGCGLWDSFDLIDGLHHEESRVSPREREAALYEGMLPRYRLLAE
ncbi:MAG: pentose kinase, partial [Planctomycetota bacterium]|nr:pentose kinase [Planctomycetota bacterium]